VTNLARMWAVRAGTTQKGTHARLDAATHAAQDPLDTDVARELFEAFHFLWEIRLRHQAEQVAAGQSPDDYVDPASLGPFSRSGLKEAFRVIARAQRLVASEEGIRPP
jgi:CBS domain-containing protein